MSRAALHLGHVFHLSGDPGPEDAPDALREYPDGYLAVDAKGRIIACGDASDRGKETEGLPIEDHRGAFLLPGFVDTHIHFPQVYARNRFGGGQLLEWLEHCVFPAEARLEDPLFAARAARDFCDSLAIAGTTCALIYGSQFPKAQEALVDALRVRGLRAIIGRTTMVEGPPSAEPLLSSEEDSLRMVEEEIERWHPDPAAARDALIQVAVIPRFSLSMNRSSLRSLGELYARHRDKGVYFSSHLSENDRPGDGEVQLVKQRFEVHHYLDTYDGRFLSGSGVGGESFLGGRSVLAHAVHCTTAELHRLEETGCGISHCPSSQLFLGSGTMPLRRLWKANIPIGLGTDVGAGDSFAIPDVVNSAFKVHMSAPEGSALAVHPARLLHLATLGGAQALDLQDRIGNLDRGKDADFLVVDPANDPSTAQLLRSPDVREGAPIDRLFALLMSMGGRAVSYTYVQGKRVNLFATGMP